MDIAIGTAAIFRGDAVTIADILGRLCRVTYADGTESNWFPSDKLKEPKKLRVGCKDDDYVAATTEGLTHFYTVDNDRDEPNLDAPEYGWLVNELKTRGYVITVYATKTNKAQTVETLATLTGITPEQAEPFITVTDRKGGSKWNIDFANFKELTTSVRDQIGVNFGHVKATGRKPNIRKIRIGSTRFVQSLIAAGFAVTKFPEVTNVDSI